METAVNENSELVGLLNPLLHLLWPSVCDCLSVSVTSRCSVETDGRTNVIFGTEASVDQSYTVLCGNSSPAKIRVLPFRTLS